MQKVVKNNWTGSSGTTISHLKYVYDGNNQIAELNGSNNTVLSTYVWGLDLSGTNWGAGGVGGLLMIKDGSKVYFPGYDGNGNVSGLVDSADGSLDAKYEYAAFGETLRVGGTAIADDNPFRFSTKYTDVDGARKRVDGDTEGVARRAEEAGAPWALMRQSGLIYYGFRYYSPSLGRFLNRDPLGELGGSNLYGFVENDPVNGWDYLGLDDELICGPSESDAGLCDPGSIWEPPTEPEDPNPVTDLDLWAAEYKFHWQADVAAREAARLEALYLEQVADVELERMDPCHEGGCPKVPQKPQGDGSSILEAGSGPEEGEDGFFSGLADIGQGLIGIAGLVPVLGNAADAINATISAGRGNYVDASLDGFSALPGAGQVVGAVNVSRKVSRGAKGIWKSVKKLVKKDAPKTVGKIDDTASAATTVGRQGQQHSFPNPKAPRPRNTPGTVNGRDYTGHALDRIQEPGLTPSVVEDTIKHGVPSTGRGGATIYRSGQATVILNPNGSVKTVY